MSHVGEVLVAATALAVYMGLEAFRKTSHGSNPWSTMGVLGVVSIYPHVMAAAKATGATWNSVYRCSAIMRKLYDAKRSNPDKWAVVVASAKSRGMDVEAYVNMLVGGSRHVRGLAADFSRPPKQGRTVAQEIGILADELFALAKAGKMGRVKKVLDERDHAHVEFWAPWETAKAPTLERV